MLRDKLETISWAINISAHASSSSSGEYSLESYAMCGCVYVNQHSECVISVRDNLRVILSMHDIVCGE